MSLNDRYNRGGGRLDQLDQYLTLLGDRAGDSWQARTGISRNVLTQGLYVFATWSSMQHVVLARDPSRLLIVGMALMAMLGMTRSRGGLVEQVQLEAVGLPRRTLVILRVWFLFFGLLDLAIGLGDLLVAAQTGVAPTLETINILLLGAALTALQAADYISRTNPTFPSRGLRMPA